MPVYEYECEGGHRFTGIRRMADRHGAVCPACGKQAKLNISLSNFKLAVPVTFVTPEHGVVHRRPDGGQSPPIRRPESTMNLMEV